MFRAGRAGSIAAVVLVTVTAPGAVAPGAVAAAASAYAASTPATACTVEDRRLNEISGLAVAGGGYVVINDGSDDGAHRRIFYLTSRCTVRRKISYPSAPRDTEDLAVAADGTLWVADIGDNDRSRATVALWRLAPGAAKPVLYRFAYPDRQHNAETLVLDGNGTPVIITKDPFSAGLYVPATTPRAGATTALRKAGSFRIPRTSTPNPFGMPGRLVLTGGATTVDGTKVVLRTYADAFEFPVTGGDVIAAITTGTAITTALPDEPQGESIAYTADGAWLLTVSETADAPPGTRPTILRYPSALQHPTAPRQPSGRAAVVPSSTVLATPPTRSERPATAARRQHTPTDLAATVGAGALVLALIALGLGRTRKRRAAGDPSRRD